MNNTGIKNIKINNILVIIKKQLIDTFKNKTVLIQFIMFPLLTVIFEHAIKIDDMPEHFFSKLFSVMYIGMAPLTSVASIIAEEKERNTLRVLIMANVKPVQYLLGVCIYVWIICMLGACMIATGLNSSDIPFYMLIMAIGFALSALIGACIGLYAKNQMAATSVVMPVMVVFAFLPMLSMFNDNIKKIAKFFYTEQLKRLLDEMTYDGMTTGSVLILAINVALMIVLFLGLFKKKGLE
ncbi:MAG: ABC transporter permease [Lachnospiraceae bacterium]|nr:ABC transporter permease [Lachnospiraceae bacterium]